jgi:vitamin B12 transporter
MKFVLGTAIVLALAAARAAPADEPDEAEPFDADGDGDIDGDDRRILQGAERVEIVDKSEGQKLRESARAITVIDTKVARERTADMGEVLSRAQGIQVRRSGGLGSSARLSLNGLYDDQIRVFLDGVPLALAGWGSGIANVPVEVVQRIDVHRGVVPIALGADALGGAIDLVTDPSWVNRASASYQVGSFGTHRAVGTARARDPGSGAAFGVNMFFDRARNDYPVDVEVTDAEGRVATARVPRFHDGYRAAGAGAELGIIQRGSVERALLRLYLTKYDKELQHNTVMTVPYGAATHGETTRGATLETRLARGPWRARLLGGVAQRAIDFDDRADVVYDWYGHSTRTRLRPGEVGEQAYQRIREVGAFARLTIDHVFGRHTLRVASAPTVITRSGTSFIHDPASGRDPLNAKRDLLQAVHGVEHELRADGDRFENIAFVKHYIASIDAEDVAYMADFIPVSRSTRHVGFGDALRYAITPRVIAKASYERSTRLPSADEVFGDGVLVRPNLAIEPERSHNLNLGARFDAALHDGGIQLDLNGFARLTEKMIIPLYSDRSLVFENVYAARVLGVEAGGSWIAPAEWATLEGSVTLQDIRNASSAGTFGQFDGDRIPNRPWLLAALAGTVRTRRLIFRDDELSLFANSRYVHRFFRGWESFGAPDSKQVIAKQLVHGVGLTYAIRSAAPVTTTLEVQNLLDARVFDSFGVQRPGRALVFKLAVEL